MSSRTQESVLRRRCWFFDNKILLPIGSPHPKPISFNMFIDYLWMTMYVGNVMYICAYILCMNITLCCNAKCAWTASQQSALFCINKRLSSLIGHKQRPVCKKVHTTPFQSHHYLARPSFLIVITDGSAGPSVMKLSALTQRH